MAEQPKRPPNPWGKSLAMWVVILLVLVVVVSVFSSPSGTSAQVTQLPYSDFIAKVEEGSVKEVEMRGQEIAGRLSNDQVFRTYTPPNGDPELVRTLRERGVRFDAKPEE